MLASSGKIDDAIKVIKAVRDRFDGEKRNPWNEFECGSNYARSMASYALLPIFSGFESDLPRNYIGFNPITKRKSCKYFWSLETAWGEFSANPDEALLIIKDGSLKLSSLGLKFTDMINKFLIDGNPVDFEFKNGIIKFGYTNVEKEIKVLL